MMTALALQRHSAARRRAACSGQRSALSWKRAIAATTVTSPSRVACWLDAHPLSLPAIAGLRWCGMQVMWMFDKQDPTNVVSGLMTAALREHAVRQQPSCIGCLHTARRIPYVGCLFARRLCK